MDDWIERIPENLRLGLLKCVDDGIEAFDKFYETGDEFYLRCKSNYVFHIEGYCDALYRMGIIPTPVTMIIQKETANFYLVGDDDTVLPGEAVFSYSKCAIK